VSGRAPVELVWLWHHHQPDYRSPRDGIARLPWVSLHATKDYLDMARRLERHPRVRAAFNFVPTLIDQLEAAATGGADALMDLLGRPVAELAPEQRAEVCARCAIAPRWALERWPAYAALVRRVRSPHGAMPLGDGEVEALQAWFALAWVDPMFHREPEAARALAERGRLTAAHRDELLALHRRLIGQVLPAYRGLAHTGQIELSASAYFHPILPLLVNLQHARRARPDLALPSEPFAAPEDAARQIERALTRHAEVFGAPARGMWPPEGSVSPEVVALAARAGVRWLASDEGVLWRSLPAGRQARGLLYRPWRFATADGDVALFFRDHELSDRIGFVYQHWNPEEAAADFMERLRRIGREHRGERPAVVSVILDGENCWENYAEDGGPFLEALYIALENSNDVRTRTPTELLEGWGEPERLENLHTGSWIDADFHIWIGHEQKNRAWDLVARTRRALVEAGTTPSSRPAAWHALLAAEGSDWFWWFGEDHFTEDQALFDIIFREHLQAVYERAGLATPGALRAPIVGRHARVNEDLPLGFIQPVIDGRRTDFFEWHEAGCYRMGAGGGSMHRGAGLVRSMHFGFDPERLYLRLDFAPDAPNGTGDALALEWFAPRPGRVRIEGLRGLAPRFEWEGGDRSGPVSGATGRCVEIAELALPLAALGLRSGDVVELIVHLIGNGGVAESAPPDDVLRFVVPTSTFAQEMWSA